MVGSRYCQLCAHSPPRWRGAGGRSGHLAKSALRSSGCPPLLPSSGLSPRPIPPRLKIAARAQGGLHVHVKCLSLGSRPEWHHRRRFLLLCLSSQQPCRTLSVGPRMLFRTWPSTRRLTALCSKTAWSHDNRPLKYFEALFEAFLTSMLILRRGFARMIQMSHH